MLLIMYSWQLLLLGRIPFLIFDKVFHKGLTINILFILFGKCLHVYSLYISACNLSNMYSKPYILEWNYDGNRIYVIDIYSLQKVEIGI